MADPVARRKKINRQRPTYCWLDPAKALEDRDSTLKRHRRVWQPRQKDFAQAGARTVGPPPAGVPGSELDEDRRCFCEVIGTPGETFQRPEEICMAGSSKNVLFGRRIKELSHDAGSYSGLYAC